MNETALVEMVATMFGALSVYLLTVGNGRGWALGMVWIVLTGYVFWTQNILGSAVLQVFFLLTQLLGWWRWHRGDEQDLRVSSSWSSPRQRVLALVGLAGGTLVLGAWLTRSGGTAVWLDSFVTVGSVIAQTLMVAGKRECWLLWLGVNLAYIALSGGQGLWAFALLYLLFAFLALNGWREWTRDRED